MVPSAYSTPLRGVSSESWLEPTLARSNALLACCCVICWVGAPTAADWAWWAGTAGRDGVVAMERSARGRAWRRAGVRPVGGESKGGGSGVGCEGCERGGRRTCPNRLHPGRVWVKRRARRGGDRGRGGREEATSSTRSHWPTRPHVHRFPLCRAVCPLDSRSQSGSHRYDRLPVRPWVTPRSNLVASSSSTPAAEPACVAAGICIARFLAGL